MAQRKEWFDHYSDAGPFRLLVAEVEGKVVAVGKGLGCAPCHPGSGGAAGGKEEFLRIVALGEAVARDVVEGDDPI